MIKESIFMQFINKILGYFIVTFGPLLGCTLFFLPLTLFFSIPAWLSCKKHQCLFWWDLGLSIYGIIFWLISMGILHFYKGETIVNVIYEMFIIMILSLVILYIRAGFLYKYFENQKLLSLLSIMTLFIAVFLLRFFMPELPE